MAILCDSCPAARLESANAISFAPIRPLKQNGDADELMADVTFVDAATVSAKKSLYGECIVFSGSQNVWSCRDSKGKISASECKKRLAAVAAQLGGKVVGSVSKKTTMLVVGNRASKCAGKKIQKAKQEGFEPVFWTADQFRNWCESRLDPTAAMYYHSWHSPYLPPPLSAPD